jgi:hypothetical protein
MRPFNNIIQGHVRVWAHMICRIFSFFLQRQSARGLWRTSIRSEQPRRINAHEAFIHLCLSDLYRPIGGVDNISACFPADHMSPYPDTADINYTSGRVNCGSPIKNLPFEIHSFNISAISRAFERLESGTVGTFLSLNVINPLFNWA